MYLKEGKIMLCENVFCIYWNDKNCSLSEISLDIQGNCEKCIYIDIEETVLENQRRKNLNKYEDR